MNIIQKNKHYYLKHSYRQGKKVITREKYLGKEIPKNIEQIKTEFLKETKKETYEKLDEIKKKFNEQWEKYPESIKKEMMINFSVEFTYNTNAIEGSTINKEETEDIIKRKIAPNKSLRDIQETINHSKVFLKLEEQQELDINTIKKWHKDIFEDSKPDLAGKIRDYLVRVGTYLCPDWQDLEKLLQEFIKWYNDNKTTEHPIELAAEAHYRFVKIHPFGDGNGRISRLIANFILKKHQFPLIIIENKNRKSYYHALRRADKEGKEIFKAYFIRRYISSNKKYL